MVSHDRYFMDKLADQLFILEGNGEVKNFIGSYTDYREEEKEKEKGKKKKDHDLSDSDSKITAIKDTKQAKMSNKERMEFGKLDKEIETLEKQKVELIEKLNDAGTIHSDLITYSSELGKVTLLLDEKQMRWLELSELGN